MRISDWSSDVCSSDLRDGVVAGECRYSGRAAAGLAAIQTAIADRFSEVCGTDAGAAGKIGDGAGHAQDALHGAGRQLQSIECAFEQALIADRKSTRLNSSH